MIDFLVKNAWPVFFIGLFSSFILEHTPLTNYLGQSRDIGFGIILLSFYLFYLEKKAIKK